MKKFDIGFDLDGVIFDIVHPLIWKCKEKGWIPKDFMFRDLKVPRLSEQFGWEEYKEGYFLTPEFFENADIIPEVYHDVLEWTLSDVKICFLTARKHHVMDATMRRMDKLNLLRGENVFSVRTRDKADMAIDLGFRSFVDDTPYALYGMIENVHLPCLLPYNFNRDHEFYPGIFRRPWLELSEIINNVL